MCDSSLRSLPWLWTWNLRVGGRDTPLFTDKNFGGQTSRNNTVDSFLLHICGGTSVGYFPCNVPTVYRGEGRQGPLRWVDGKSSSVPDEIRVISETKLPRGTTCFEGDETPSGSTVTSTRLPHQDPGTHVEVLGRRPSYPRTVGPSAQVYVFVTRPRVSVTVPAWVSDVSRTTQTFSPNLPTIGTSSLSSSCRRVGRRGRPDGGRSVVMEDHPPSVGSPSTTVWTEGSSV